MQIIINITAIATKIPIIVGAIKSSLFVVFSITETENNILF